MSPSIKPEVFAVTFKAKNSAFEKLVFQTFFLST